MTDEPARPGAAARPGRASDRGQHADRAQHADLAGNGRSAVSPEAAMRARDLDRPTAADMARSHARLTIVRRNWTPPAG